MNPTKRKMIMRDALFNNKKSEATLAEKKIEVETKVQPQPVAQIALKELPVVVVEEVVEAPEEVVEQEVAEVNKAKKKK